MRHIYIYIHCIYMDEYFFPGLKQCFVSNPLETGLETRGLKQALKHVLFQTPVSSLFQAPCFKACFKPQKIP